MCLALPARVTAIDGESARVDIDGVEMPISLAFLSDVTPGDYVVVHVGYALSKIDPAEADRQIAMMNAGLVEERV